MHIKPIWSYLNKGLLVILGFLVISTLASIIFLTHTLLELRTLVSQGGNAVTTALQLQDILISLQAGQSGVRGYVLTGDKSFLGPYETSNTQVPMDLRAVNSNKQLLLTPDQRSRINDLVRQKLAIAQDTVKLYDTDGFAAAEASIANRRGEVVMQDLRQEITSVSSTDLQGIGPMERNSMSSVRTALWVAGAMTLLTLGFCAAISWYFRRTILHERALESTKNEFLSLASHQLRTPATNVKQYVALLLDGYMGDLTEQQRHALQIAYKNNEAEISIMNNLLDVAKLDLDRIELHKKATDIMRIAKRVIRDFAPYAREAGMELRLTGPQQLLARVDEQYIHGVIENLVDNAIKYSKAPGRVTIQAWKEDDEVCIAVRDRGLGIRKRDFGKLFIKFSRLDNEFSANSQGSGLGLYWVRKVIQLHEGRIELRTREGVGSVFTVHLPVR